MGQKEKQFWQCNGIVWDKSHPAKSPGKTLKPTYKHLSPQLHHKNPQSPLTSYLALFYTADCNHAKSCYTLQVILIHTRCKKQPIKLVGIKKIHA